ncbi:MAG: hypothetical protein E2O68_00110 [Deltaproteobacteria bacterium]|nr:MAG: hypothetical protein E2O68_00110 [Deltaproteobacteria bacterium]
MNEKYTVPKLNYRDTSKTQSEQIYREMQQTRIDMNYNAQQLRKTQMPQRDLNSPYISDREGYTPRIKGSLDEGNWRYVAPLPQDKFVYLNMRKLDIV